MEKEREQACNGSQEQDCDQQEDPVENMDEEAAAKEKLTAGDPNKVKFTTVSLDGFDGKNGEAKVDILVVQTSVGMGKEELMKYANEPFWVRLRMALFVLFWVAWIAMLVGAIVIILLAPRCPPAPSLEWYQKTAMYQVNVETFKDSDGDGIGDLRGLISKLDYFKDQNVGTLMLSAVFKTSHDSDGLIDHTEVDRKYGTIADFEDLMKEMSKKDIKIVMDFNPNHSSDEHPWFMASVEGQEPYKDFYVWANPDNDGPPNNWLSVKGGSAWEYNEQRKQYYLHTYDANLPDLNLRNELVRSELRDILKFWLEKGVDGFKVLAASHLVQDESLRDEPLKTSKTVDQPKYYDFNHIHTLDQPENLGLFAEWREILKNFTESTGIRKILLAEVSGTISGSMPYYGNETHTLAEFPMNPILTTLHPDITGTQLKENLEAWYRNAPAFSWPNWLIGSKRVPRLASRVGSSLVDGIHMVAMLTKGTPISYFGDELGLEDQDHSHHDHRTTGKILPGVKQTSTQSVMVWLNDTFGGFTNGTSSFMLNPDYQSMNVLVQEKDKQSHLKIYSRLLALRNQPAINFGIQGYPVIGDDIFSMLRVRKGSPGYLVVLNMGQNATVVDFTGSSGFLPETARVEIRSGNVKDGPLADGEHPKLQLSHIPLESKQAAVFSFVPQFEG